MKLRTKIFCFFTALLTASFALLLMIVHDKIGMTNQTITESLSMQVMESKAQEAGSWLNQRVSELRMISLQDAALHEDIEYLKPYIDRLNTRLGSSFGNEWGTFAIGGKDGLGWVSDEITIDISMRDYFEEAMTTDREYVLSKPVISKTDEAPICLICYPLKNQYGETFGFLNGAISLNKLTELVGQIEFYDGESWIMDTEGNIYTGAGTYPKEQILTGVLPSLNYIRTEGTTPLSYTDRSQLVFFTDIPSTDNWFLCTAVKKEKLMEDTSQLQIVLLMVWLMVLIVSLVCCIVLSGSVTRSVRKLEHSMALVEKGDLSIRAVVKGKDEIASLSVSFNQMLDQIELLMEQVVRQETQQKDAELRLLQSQINPHFLYNSLDTLQWKAYEYNDDGMSRMIAALSSFFRISLSKGKEFITLSKEIEHIQNYLYIQQIRFQDVLSYGIESEVEGERYTVLKLMLQPLVENAIQHGIKPRLSPCRIQVHVKEQDGCLILSVSDDGVGMSEEKLNQVKEDMVVQNPERGYGLYNVNQRLKFVYGVDYGLTISSKEGIGTCVSVRIPSVRNR